MLKKVKKVIDNLKSDVKSHDHEVSEDEKIIKDLKKTPKKNHKKKSKKD